ncbi:type II CAAX endopeptidase family protein [Rhizobium sp. AB2/73]|uniref:CPBP family intramembrane glutamic endopeptidase n=1 Tax=Rhizobium sp. AB2/73 TaxID=2795216 RepID=UPI001C60542F|nr:type II CAAX endopeptidase family protein [Rhizobium sp. AB2/73]QYA13181.1 CPBP family intramembrane metalloprotease [Rhizobium sp. AB2/73]
MTNNIARNPSARPGWPEISIGLVGISIVGLGGGAALAQLGMDPVRLGLIFTALSGIGGLAGFFAAFLLRSRSWRYFGIRRTTWGWLGIGAALGVVAFVAKGVAIFAYISFTGDRGTPQDIYLAGASGGIWTVVVATFLFSVVTPIGEEFLFRGVVTNALLKYGAVVGVVGGATIFAVFHGINVVFPAAFVAGLAAGEVFRRSGSIWPAVVVHSVVNLPTIPVMVLASAS